MGQPSFFDNVREWISGVAFAIYLWSIRMTKEEFWAEQDRQALEHVRQSDASEAAPGVADESLKENVNTMRTIHMLKGLPASGKTTLALEMAKEEKLKRVSKDDLRAMLHGGKYSLETEMFVLDVRNVIAKLAIEKGFDIVIDDTNLNPVHEEQLGFLADSLGARLDVINVNTPLDVCILRDKARPNSVGEAVIRGMYEKYITGKQGSDVAVAPV